MWDGVSHPSRWIPQSGNRIERAGKASTCPRLTAEAAERRVQPLVAHRRQRGQEITGQPVDRGYARGEAERVEAGL